MSAKEDDELCDLFERVMDLRKMKSDFMRLALSQGLETEDEEKTLTTSLPEIISGMHSTDFTRIRMATQSLRRMLKKQSNPPTEKIIEAGLLTLLVKFLGCDNEPVLQYEAARVLMATAAGTSQQRNAVVQAGAVPQLIRLLASPKVCIAYYCVFVLGHIIGDGAKLRDFVIENGILTPLMRLVDMNAPPFFLEVVAWVIKNLCRNNNPPPKLEATNACLSALRILIRHTDYGVLSYTCLALYYIVDNSDLIQQVVNSPVLSRIVQLLGNPEPRVIIAALQTICKIVRVNGSHTLKQAVIECNVLQMLPPLLQHSDVNIKICACSVLSYISEGTSEHIQAVINCNLLPLVVEVLITGDLKSQRQATWVIIGVVGRGTLEHIIYVVQCGALKSLCDLLTTEEASLLNVVLEGIFSVLKATNKFGQAEYLYVMLKEMGSLDTIEKLQNHKDFRIKYKSYNIIHKFFSR